MFSGRSVIWGLWGISCEDIESQGRVTHFFESLQTFGCALRMGVQQLEKYTLPSEK